MPSEVRCERGHRGGKCRDAAIEMSKLGNLGPCASGHGGHECNEKRRYRVSQRYTGSEAEEKYEVVKVARLLDDEHAEAKGDDTMLFLLRKESTGEEFIWPFWWGKDGRGHWRVGQFPPLFGVGELSSLLEKLGRK